MVTTWLYLCQPVCVHVGGGAQMHRRRGVLGRRSRADPSHRLGLSRGTSPGDEPTPSSQPRYLWGSSCTPRSPHPRTGGQPKGEPNRRAPGPSLARHRSCEKSLVAQIGLRTWDSQVVREMAWPLRARTPHQGGGRDVVGRSPDCLLRRGNSELLIFSLACGLPRHRLARWAWRSDEVMPGVRPR
jgi:hypothetical protein